MRIAPLLLLLAGCTQDANLGVGQGTTENLYTDSRLQVSTDEIVISDIEGAYSKSAQFTVTSIGTTNLLLYEIRVVNDAAEVFYFEEVDDVELAPQQVAEYTIVAQLENGEPAYAELRIRSNDPEQSTLILPVHAYPMGYVPPEDTGGDTASGSDTASGGDTAADTGAR